MAQQLGPDGRPLYQTTTKPVTNNRANPTVTPPTAPLMLQSSAPALNPANPNNPPVPTVPPSPFSAATAGAFAPTMPHTAFSPTTAPYGMDMTAPGVGEQMQQSLQDKWLSSPNMDWVHDNVLPQLKSPLAGEQSVQDSLGDKGSNFTGDYWEGVQGAGNTPVENRVGAGYNDPNLAKAAFGQIQGALPGSLQPQFDKYYDRMHDKAVSDVNAQGAARGSYGSNASLNNSIGAGIDVEAQRAKAATDFSLADSANQRDWMSLLGSQGSAADASGVNAYNANIAGSRYGLDKTKTLGDLAFNADKSELARDQFGLDKAKTLDDMTLGRLGAGTSTAFGMEGFRQSGLQGAQSGATSAQTSHDNRVNTLYNQISGFGSDVQNFVTENYDALLGGDKQMSDDELQTMFSKYADERGWDQQQKDENWRGFKAAMDIVKGSETAGASGGGS